MTRTKIINQSKKAFIDALLELLKSNSFDQITIKQLCLVSGYSTRTYYRYFDNKKDILQTMFKFFLADYKSSFKNENISIITIPNHVLKFLLCNKDKVTILCKSNLFVPLIMDNIEELSSTLLKIKVPWRTNVDNKNNDYRKAVMFSIGGFTCLIDNSFKKEEVYTLDDTIFSLKSSLKEMSENLHE